MTTARTLTSVFVIVLLAALLPRLAWEIFEIFVLKASQYAKIGPWHFIRPAAFHIAIDGAIAGIVAVALTAASLKRRPGRHGRYVSAAWLGGLVLSAAPFLLPHLSLFDWGLSFLSWRGTAALNWAIVCAIVLPIAYALRRDVSRPSSPSQVHVGEHSPAGNLGNMTSAKRAHPEDSGAGPRKERVGQIASRCLMGAVCAPFGATITVAFLALIVEFAKRGADASIFGVLSVILFSAFYVLIVSVVFGWPVLFLLALVRLDNVVVVMLIGVAVGGVFALLGVAILAVGGIGGGLNALELSIPVIGGGAAGFTAWACSRPTA